VVRLVVLEMGSDRPSERRAMTARRKPAKRAGPIRAPGWLAILLLVALTCIIGGVLL
jgi:hypothetical protein